MDSKRISFKFVANLCTLFGVCIFAGIVIVRTEMYASLSSNFYNPQRRHLAEADTIEVSLDQIMKSPVVLQQDEPKFIKKIQNDFIIPPSEKEYDLISTKDTSMGQSKKIMEILGEMRNGFFIECGALDGETRSNTLVFEKELGWNGLLVEGDPKNFEKILLKNRKCFSVSACLSTRPYPNEVMFQQSFNLGKISDAKVDSKKHGMTPVQCFPAYSLMLAMNTTKIDYFSLDVEGHELEVLQTIPWDKVQIVTLSVEFIHGKDGKEVLRDYMESQGYKVYSEVTHSGGLANDFIFYHPNLLNKGHRLRED